MTPRKRGLAPAARAIVTKYREESQSKLVEWLKDGGLLEDSGGDLEKVKQQIKRRKMTLKRKQKRVALVSEGEGGECGECVEGGEHEREVEATENANTNTSSITAAEEDDDPLYSAKINMLQDDSFVSLIDPPEQHARLDSPRSDPYNSDEDHFSEGAPFVGGNPFGDGPYSPTTVIDEVSHSYHSFHSVFEHPPLLHTTDLFPRTSHDYPLTHVEPAQKREKPCTNPHPGAGLDPSGIYYHAAV